jgi:hypothetical protein
MCDVCYSTSTRRAALRGWLAHEMTLGQELEQMLGKHLFTERLVWWRMAAKRSLFGQCVALWLAFSRS